MIAWLTGKLAGPVLGAASVVLLFGLITLWAVDAWKISSLTSDRDSLRAELKVATDNLSTCHASIGTLEGAVSGMRGDIDKLAKDTKNQNDSLAKAMSAQVPLLRGIRASATKLLSMPPTAPVGSLQACAAGAAVYRGPMP